MINDLLARNNPEIKPEAGMGITLLSHSDRHPGTISSVNKSGKSFYFTKDKYDRVDQNGMSESQEYVFTTEPDSGTYQARLRKDGTWRVVGSGTRIALGYRSAYYDYSF